MREKYKRRSIPPSTVRRLRAEVFGAAPGLEVAETLFDTMGDVLFCVKNVERRYVAVNAAFLRRARLNSRTELLGRTASEVFPPVLSSGYERQDEAVLARGESVRDRLEMITQPDGGIGWFVSQKIAVKSVSGKIVALAGMSRDLAMSAARGAEAGILAHALEQLHRHCGESLRIEALARESGLSWSQFQRRIRAVAGLSPRQLLTKARVEAAVEALRDSDRPLSDIAFECGFYDQAAFSRQFRAATGLSPGEYRRGLRGLETR